MKSMLRNNNLTNDLMKKYTDVCNIIFLPRNLLIVYRTEI